MSNYSFLNNISLFDLHLELFKRRDFELFTRVANKKHVKQEKALEFLTNSFTKEVGFGGGAGGAKTITGVYWLTMVAHQYPGSYWFVCREELKDLRNTVSSSFRKVWRILGYDSNRATYNGQDNYFEFDNGSRVYYLAGANLPSDPMFERFGSYELAGGMFEEAGQLSSLCIQTLISRCGRDKEEIPLKILSTFNPNKGAVYRRYYRPWKQNTLPKDRVFIPSLVSDNPFISKQYVENLENLEDQKMKQRLLYGNFDFDDDPAKLIDPQAIENMFTNTFVQKSNDNYITVDPSGKGKDTTAIYVWSGFKCIYQYVEKQTDQSQLLDKIEKLRIKFNIVKSNVGVDYTGIGTGLVDIGKYTAIVTGGSPIELIEDKIKKFKMESYYLPYQNMRSQLWFLIAKIINDNKIHIDLDGFDLNSDITPTEFRDRLVEELDVIKEVSGGEKTRKVISKGTVADPKVRQTIKSLLGRSPDLADNIMHRAYFEIKKPFKVSFNTF